MKIEDLRVGNLINYGQVYRIDKNYISASSSKGTWSNHIDLIKPVNITEEWLFRFGFLIDYDEGDIKYYVISTNHNFGIKVYDNSEYYIYHEYVNTEEYTILKEIFFIHELQNVWFSLTNEELKKDNMNDKEIENFVDEYIKLLEDKVNKQNQRMEELMWSTDNGNGQPNGLHSYIRESKPMTNNEKIINVAGLVYTLRDLLEEVDWNRELKQRTKNYAAYLDRLVREIAKDREVWQELDDLQKHFYDNFVREKE